jgi:pimeloyl-ACP methyl ester carboxylesterase
MPVLSEKMVSAANHKCWAIMNIASGIPIVFLHGYSFTSDVWRRTSVTELLKEKNVSFLALDMPYGPKSDCQPKTRDTEINVAVIRDAVSKIFGLVAPVLVGASLGGQLAAEYAARFPVKGLLLTSPVDALEEKLARAYSKFSFPVRIIYGSEDNIVSLEQMRNLADRLPNSKLRIYESAGHSAYLSQPDRFKRDLLELYAQAEQS